jgi:hypothetical protein
MSDEKLFLKTNFESYLALFTLRFYLLLYTLKQTWIFIVRTDSL